MVSTTVFADSFSAGEVGSFTVTEISAVEMTEGGVDGTLPTKPGDFPGSTTGTGTVGTTGTSGIGNPGPIFLPGTGTDWGYQRPDRTEQVGRVIGVAREVVGLGEAIYDLAKKGKPTNVTEFAPISIVPKNPTTKEYIDPFDLDNFSMPVEKNFVASVKNTRGKEVVSFKYKVFYSYGGSFNGTGKYLTGVIIVPSEIKTSFGWDFNASMKLTGIMNHGTKENPVAGAMITVKYQFNSWFKAYERNDTVHITGNGDLKVHNAE